jgi:hypothetical protein
MPHNSIQKGLLAIFVFVNLNEYLSVKDNIKFEIGKPTIKVCRANASYFIFNKF